MNSNFEEGATAVIRQAKERGLSFPMVKDAGGALARRLGAAVTPEVVLIDGAGVLRYRGRIDDQRIAAAVKMVSCRAVVWK